MNEKRHAATPQRLKELHDQLGAMIDQVGHPDYSLRELVDELRDIRNELLRAAQSETVEPTPGPTLEQLIAADAPRSASAAKGEITDEHLNALLAARSATATKEQRDAIIEECAKAVDGLAAYAARMSHWTSDEHDGILLSAQEVRGLKSGTVDSSTSGAKT